MVKPVENLILSAALDLARAGIKVFPVYGVSGSSCTCGKPNCSSPGKHPIPSNGFKAATTEVETIKAWWADHPDANIGLPTGSENGIFVFDIDPKNGGDTSLSSLESEHGPLPATLKVKTGSGGQHFYFLYPKGGARNSAGKLGSGIDVRGDGGYVVAPPSMHVAGDRYSWDGFDAMSRDALVAAPDWLLELTHASDSRSDGLAQDASGGIKEGERNSTLFSLAGSMRAGGMQEDEIFEALLRVNSKRCDPPLPEAEVHRIRRPGA